MVWIINKNSATRCLFDEALTDLDDVDDLVEDLPGEQRGVVFNDNGTAQVTDDIAEVLVEYDTITYKD